MVPVPFTPEPDQVRWSKKHRNDALLSLIHHITFIHTVVVYIHMTMINLLLYASILVFASSEQGWKIKSKYWQQLFDAGEIKNLYILCLSLVKLILRMKLHLLLWSYPPVFHLKVTVIQ